MPAQSHDHALTLKLLLELLVLVELDRLKYAPNGNPLNVAPSLYAAGCVAGLVAVDSVGEPEKES